MDDAEKLRALETRRDNIERGIKNIDQDIRGAEDALIRGEPPERLVQFIRDRNADLRDHLQDLGRVEAQIDLQGERTREHASASWERKEADRWDAEKPGDRAWYRKPSVETRSQEQVTDKQREWYKPDRQDEKPPRDDDRTTRHRER